MSKSGSDGFPDDDKFSRSVSRSRSPSPAPRPTQNRRIVIANIPYDVSWHDIRELFRDRLGFAGYLQMYKENGRSNGMASMEFKTLEGADKAIQLMNRFILNGRKLVVREECARDKERLSIMDIDNDAPKISTRPPIIDDRGFRRGHMEHPPNMSDNADTFLSDSVYISNLEFSVSAAKIRNVLKAAGEVVNVKLKTDPEGNPRGVAIVSFSHPSEATSAVKMFNGQNLKDRTMRVRIYRSDPMGEGSRMSGGPIRSVMGRPSFSDQPRYPRGPMPSMNPPAPAPVQSAAAAAATLSLLLGGSPEAAAFGHLLSGGGGSAGGPGSNGGGGGGMADILRMLAATGGADGGIDGASGSRGGPRMDNRYAGDAYNRPPRVSNAAPPASALQQLMTAALSGGMRYTQIASSLSALGYDVPHEDSMMSRMNVDHDLGDRRRGDTYYAASRDRSRPRILPSGPPILAGRTKPSFMPSGPRHRDEDRNGRRDTNRVTSSDGRGGGTQVEVVVKNLPYSYAWQDVKRIFRESGNVHHCNMPLDPEGKSQGVAYIGYSSANECESAVDRFNGSVFDGRRIKVQLAA